jgi:hypothetical protein
VEKLHVPVVPWIGRCHLTSIWKRFRMTEYRNRPPRVCQALAWLRIR